MRLFSVMIDTVNLADGLHLIVGVLGVMDMTIDIILSSTIVI